MPDFAVFRFRSLLSQPWRISYRRRPSWSLGHGGPEWSGIGAIAKPQLMSALESSALGRAFHTLRQTTVRTNYAKAKISTTHDRAFGQHLTDHGIHHIGCSQKPNLRDVLKALSTPRKRLPLCQTCDKDFEIFMQRHLKAKNEAEVVASVIPMIMGEREETSPVAMNKMFRNLEPLTNTTIPSAKPDFCYGALPDDLDSSIRSELGQFIIPGRGIPILPNFFLEVKGPDGRPFVANQQARHDGAIGARGMHSLQNHLRKEPVYDDRAYSFSSTYQDGHLVLFSHHLTSPTISEGRPEYHMTQLKSYALTCDRKTFMQGVTAIRKLRDLAKLYRDKFINDANSRHSDNAIASGQVKKTGLATPKTS